MTYNIAFLPGDGIGREVAEQAALVLNAAAERFGFSLVFTEKLIGGCAIDACGAALPEDTLKTCLESDAVLLGAVGGPKWDGGAVRPESGLLEIRAGMGLFANLRPAKLWPQLESFCPLKKTGLEDILIIRELTGGLYFGEKGRAPSPGGTRAFDSLFYCQEEISRIARLGFEKAKARCGRLTSVDKANVLESSRLWRETVTAMSREYPGVALSHMYVDNASMQLVLNPGQFDVIVTENMFGDILSDEAGAVTGSIGLLPSASLGAPGTPGLFEPVHGSAPEIAGEDIANPIAAILSAAMLLRDGLMLPEPADAIERAVGRVLDEGVRTADLTDGESIGTAEMGRRIAGAIAND